MCNLSKGVFEKGFKIGVEKACVSSLCAVMETLDLSLEQAMAALGVPEEERPKYRSLVEAQ